MKIEKYIPIASKIEFVNEYIAILMNKYTNNNTKISNYYKNNDMSTIYNINDLQKKPELAHLIYDQMNITYKINIGKALKNDIISTQHYNNIDNN